MVNYHYMVYVEHSDFPAFFVTIKQLNILLAAVLPYGQSVIIISFVLARSHRILPMDRRTYFQVINAFIK